MKRTVIAMIVFALGVALLSASIIVDPCFAGQCKHENAECTINSSEKPCCPGLVCVPFNEQSGNGKCRTEEPPPPPPCVPDGTAVCPTECGYDGGTIQDNCGNTIQCNPTADCPPDCVPDGSATCPTQCGYAGGEVVDNCGNVTQCQATEECVVPPPPPPPDKPPKGDKPAVLPVTGM